MSALLELQGVTRTFGSLVANDAIDLVVRRGRVHAIVGENGAGKTTLMSMVIGTAVPDAGRVLVDGEPVSLSSPRKAAALGIGMVFQHFMLVDSMTVAANVFLGREPTRRGTVDTAAMEAQVRHLSQRFGLDVDPTAIAGDLSVGQLQRVELLKALSHDTRLLILDEPTAVLTPAETDDLFVVIRALAATGVAVIFISHKLDEVLAVADDLTVIRDGRLVATVPADGLSRRDVARMMVGRDVLLRVTRTPATPGDTVLDVAGLRVLDRRGVAAVDGVDLAVRSGEIVAIAGVEGNGQAELTAAIAGLQRPVAGTITLAGADITASSVAARRDRGLAYIPEDRQQVGTGPGMSVADNLIATHLTPPVARAGWLSRAGVRRLAGALIDRFDIRGARPATPVGSLSGGNTQKVVIARELESDPAVLIASQPTRGVDVGATEFVHAALIAARDRGAGVLLVTADLAEAMSLSDRLLVLHRGRVVAQFTPDTMDETAIGLAMAGVAAGLDAAPAAAGAVPAGPVPTSRESARPVPASPVSSSAATAPRESGGPVPAPPAPAPAVEPAAARSTPTPPKGTGTPAGRADGDTAPRPGGWGAEVLETVFTNSVQPVLAVAVALAVGFVIILAFGKDPVLAYRELFFSSFVSPPGIGALLAQTVPLLVLSAAVIISFRAGFFSIGGEGQLFVGALGGALLGVALSDTGLPGGLQSALILAAGFACGAAWGAIPGALFARWRVDIIVTTLMMSSIATLLTAYLVTGPFRDPRTGTVASRKVSPDAMLPVFAPRYGFGLDLIIAVAVVAALGLVLTRSVWGLRVRQLGELNRFAQYTGVDARAMSVQVMSLAGGISGLAGALFVLGPNSGGRFVQQFSPGYGFLAITVALLARLNPWAAVVASVFYATMMAGSNAMQLTSQVPYPLVGILQGLIVLTITGTFAVNRRRRRPRPTSRAVQAARG